MVTSECEWKSDLFQQILISEHINIVMYKNEYERVFSALFIKHCIFFVILTSYFLQINALNDKMFIWNLGEMC